MVADIRYAASIAVISASVAIKVYKSPLFKKRFWLLSTTFLLLVPLAWHIKQPYIGAALFPMVIVYILILIRQFSLKNMAYIFGFFLAVALLIIGTTFVWNSFLHAQGNPMPEQRQITTMLEESLADQVANLDLEPFDFLMNKADEYLAISNYYSFNFRTHTVDKNPIIGRGNENTIIPHTPSLPP
jgi:hypothetical protein